VVEFFDLARAGQPDLRLEELAITEGSPLAGRSLQELRGPAVPLLVRHPDGQLIANPARELQLQQALLAGPGDPKPGNGGRLGSTRKPRCTGCA
jgi:hypothetical protein